MTYKCTTHPEQAEFVACMGVFSQYNDATGEMDSPIESSVLLDQAGAATNRWEDGVVGVPVDVQETAERHAEECNPYCPICWEEADWVNGG